MCMDRRDSAHSGPDWVCVAERRMLSKGTRIFRDSLADGVGRRFADPCEGEGHEDRRDAVVASMARLREVEV